MGLLNEKVALVTGAGGGVGRAHALLLAREGAKVVVNDLGCQRDGKGSESALADRVVHEIREAGGEAVASYDTVATQEGGEAMTKTALETFGRLDIVVANAGILRDKSFAKLTPDLWHSIIDVHLNGAYYTVRPAFLHMKERGGGRIVLTTSTSGLFGNFGQVNYASAKAGIAGFTRALALEGRKYGITVNAIAPAALTRMSEDLPFLQDQKVRDALPPEFIAPPVAFLCTEAAADVNGLIFIVKGNDIEVVTPQRTPVATRAPSDGPWDVAAIGEEMRKAAASVVPPKRLLT